METEFVNLPIKTDMIGISQMQVTKASDFAKNLISSESCTLIQCLKVSEFGNFIFHQGDEVVVFDTVVDVGQKVENDILYVERIAIVFKKQDNITPWVFALRQSFPKVLHRISLFFESPACLCIYEQPYDDLKLNWRSQQFLFDIRNWLALTASGKLHQDDQPLEPLIVANTGNLILPPDVKPSDTLFISLVSQKNGKVNLIASRNKTSDTHDFHFMFLTGVAQQHGIVDRTPATLTDLHEFLLKANINLFDVLQRKIREISNDKTIVKQKLLLLVRLPKHGSVGSAIENDLYAFVTTDDLEEIGCQLNVLFKKDGWVGQIFPHVAPAPEKAASAGIHILVPYEEVSRQSAAFYSGQSEINIDSTIALVGVGALGSQVLMNLVKSGFGKWKLIDSDILLPHNTVRHFLPPFYLGQPKSLALAIEVNLLLNQAGLATGIWEDYLHPSDSDSLTRQLKDSNVILDISTSVAVARDLAFRRDIDARRVSVFLNPMGTDLVILAEDKARKITLDALEFQYYRALLKDEFCQHLYSTSPIRYSNSCRDITSQISQDHVSIHAGIASAQIRSVLQLPNAKIGIWHTDFNYGVKASDVEIQQYIILEQSKWSVYIDDYLITKISMARLDKLPNETGGILVGGYDFGAKRIYLLDTVLSPRDSEETPTGYIRGKEGLKEKLSQIKSRTADHLMYVGEWHSHPMGCSLEMSEDDVLLYHDIKQEMNAIGYPPLILIAGDHDGIQIYCED